MESECGLLRLWPGGSADVLRPESWARQLRRDVRAERRGKPEA